jgi:phage-related protein (TIGR01555 family)
MTDVYENAVARVAAEAEQKLATEESFANSLSSLAASLTQNDILNPYGTDSAQISNVGTIFDNLRWYLVSNLRQLLSQLYVEHGIVQTLIDQPVDDAFRSGFEIKTDQISKDEIERLKVYVEKNQVIANLMQAIKWARLFGGGAVMIITAQDPLTPLNLAAIKPETPLEFRAVDMWELYYAEQNLSGNLYPGGALGANIGEFYDYYGKKVHRSRVYRIIGKEAPSFIRPRLRGWGMSEIERLVRSLNQFLKNQDVIFELLDEAKVDVYKIKGLNTALMTNAGTAGVTQRIQTANMLKNYQNSITMDANDDYIQKQITFSGLSEVLLQIRQGIAADLKMPMTKLFGISAAGFNSGEDDIENYNSMIEGEIRAKNKFTVVDVLSICCQKLFGFIPDDMMIEFNPLRILNAKEEEEVKNSQFNRVMAAYSSGLVADAEAKSSINKDSLLPIEIDENTPALPPLGGDMTTGTFKVDGGATGSAGKKTPEQD